MPTYSVTAAAQLSGKQRRELAQVITAAHGEEMAAPAYLVQVLFHILPDEARFIGGKPADSQQIWIRGEVRAGRTLAQRTALLKRLTLEATRILQIGPELVWVYLHELLAENMLEFGNILPAPGHEQEWLRSLPEALRNNLLRLLADSKPSD